MKKIIAISIGTIFCIFCIFAIDIVSKLVFYNHVKKAQNNLDRYMIIPKKDTVNIVAITDSKYVNPLNVTIYSAIKNKNKNSKYNFFIIGVDLHLLDTLKLYEQSTDETPITIIQNDNIYKKYSKIDTHVTNTDMFKFDIPNLFPNFDKILYLDGDIIVQKDLSDLYNMDLEDNYVAANLQPYEQFPGQKNLKLEKYFNNGVMLLNLKKMREDNISDKMLKYKIFRLPRGFVTQNTFNVILQSKVKNIDETYNTCVNSLDKKKYKNINKFLKSRAIIHFAGTMKPWSDPKVLYASTWEKYHNEFKEKYKF